MKKILLVLSMLSVSALLVFCVFSIANIVSSQSNTPETFILSSQSPDGKYNLEVYRTEPGATVDFSIRAYLVNDNKKKIIYDAYHEKDADVDWLNDSTVSINGKTLDLSRTETYD